MLGESSPGSDSPHAAAINVEGPLLPTEAYPPRAGGHGVLQLGPRGSGGGSRSHTLTTSPSRLGCVTDADTRASELDASANGGGAPDAVDRRGLSTPIPPSRCRCTPMPTPSPAGTRSSSGRSSPEAGSGWATSNRCESPAPIMALEVAGMPVALVRGHDGELRAFYNVCQHRAHELLSGSGRTDSIVCGYHGWTYELTGRLVPGPAHRGRGRVRPVRASASARFRRTEFGGFVYVNLGRRRRSDWPSSQRAWATRSPAGLPTWRTSPTCGASATTSPPTGRT